MKHITRSLSLLSLPLLFVAYAEAQSNIDVHFGGGVAYDSSNGTPIDTFGTGTLYSTPKLNSTFLGAGGELMLKPHFGVGAEVNWQAAKADYAGLQFRPLFYDVNGVWRPNPHNKRFVFEAQAGLGATNLRFYQNQSACDAFAGCSSASSFVESSNHFQLHFGAAANVYITRHVFFRPELDLHWVNNFFQFGSNLVPRTSLSLGYSFGER